MPSDTAVVTVSGLPPHLAQWLALVAERAGARAVVSGPAAGVCGSTDRPDPDASSAPTVPPEPGDPFLAARSAAAEVIRAAEGVEAWVGFAHSGATGDLLRATEDDPGIDLGQHESASTRQTRRALARTAVATELQLLTGATITRCRDDVALAGAAPERVGHLRARMACGTVSLWRARLLLKETRHLDPLTAATVMRRVLTPVGRHPDDEGPTSVDADELEALLAAPALSQATVRRRLARQLALAESAGEFARRSHRDAVDARDVDTVTHPHGIASTTVTASSERAFAAQRRITTLARRARAAGDSRTLAQLRSDIATDLLIRGQVAGDALLGEAPAAHLQVVVSLAALLPDPTRSSSAAEGGARAHAHARAQTETPYDPRTAGVGEALGLGFLTAQQVRAMAFARGSIWQRLVTDPASGTVIDAESSYRPSAALRRTVEARDQHCRAPGCEHPAQECDLDHAVPWSALADDPSDGATHEHNLHTLHRGHHIAKTRQWWRAQLHTDGSVRWTTLSGQRVTTHPPDHHQPHDLAAYEHSVAERVLAALLEDHTDPPPTTPEMAAVRMRVARTQTARPTGSATHDVDVGPPPF
ncbi:HNH endonuclease signature motif containing protein [Luteipulveratus halotolerans]|uniref:DUF222 domain-containing protein n=1 Tax=Luteipulveratus halotolerans TaxID=1631356 RepID=A0A0L6CID5_9MICO|nr:HNH endonuclease signature motif containing protein [Luteipulveratus halotolerans]KNX37557.1 hypothetical protein VV01_10995 [Luteipulveratus halotolerans]